ncbi:hypothetical protein [Sphingorhabdus sp.]|uniref:hypothetical protein n=1 Tax=Sphingorhabdus sp. TaxID=1902408 RepID=UPI002FD8F1E1
MSLTSYRAAPSRATNEAIFRSPGSLFCFPFCIGKTAAGCSIPLYQMPCISTEQKRKKADIRRMNDSGPPFEL